MSVSVSPVEQRQEALDKAVKAKSEAGVLRAELKAGTLAFGAAVFDSRSGCVGVERLLMSQRGWGASRALRVLVRLGLHPRKRMDSFTERQRGLLVRAVKDLEEQ